MNTPETNIPHLEDTTLEKTKPRKWPKRLVKAAGVAVVTGMAVMGTNTLFNGDKEPRGSHTVEAPVDTPEKLAEGYRAEALPFAKHATEKLPDLDDPSGRGMARDITTEAQRKQGIMSFEIKTASNDVVALPEGNDRRGAITSVLSLKRSPEGGLTAAQLYVAGQTDTAQMRGEEQFSTVIELDPRDEVFTAETDAPFNSRDFAEVIDEATPEDVRAIKVSSVTIPPMEGRFTEGKAPEFTNATKQPTTNLPPRDTVARITDSIIDATK